VAFADRRSATLPMAQRASGPTIQPAEEVIRLTVRVEKRRESWSKGYWLGHCTGFRVDGPDERLGYVEEVLLDPEGQTPRALVVRGARTTVVPVGEIVRLLPAQERVLVGKPELKRRPAPIAKTGR
jgi:PRC-barrel domain